MDSKLGTSMIALGIALGLIPTVTSGLGVLIYPAVALIAAGFAIRIGDEF